MLQGSDLQDSDIRRLGVGYWPYAAMDYYIQLLEAPDISSLNEPMILAEGNDGASCTPSALSILQYFRDRDVLVQTMFLLDKNHAQVKFVLSASVS